MKDINEGSDAATIREYAFKNKVHREMGYLTIGQIDMDTRKKMDDTKYEELYNELQEFKKTFAKALNLSKFERFRNLRYQYKCWRKIENKWKLSPLCDYDEILAKMEEMQCIIDVYQKILIENGVIKETNDIEVRYYADGDIGLIMKPKKVK